MKRLVIGTLLAISLLLSACGTQPAATTTTAVPTTEATTAATTEATTAATTTAPTTVATTTTPTTTVAPTTTAPAPAATAPVKPGFVTIESDATQVRLTLLKQLIDMMGIDPKDLMWEAYSQGVTDIKANPDGSLTYIMTKAQYLEMLGGLKTGIDQVIKSFTSDKNTAFTSIKYNTKLTEITVKVDRKKFSSADAMAVSGLAQPAMVYQIFSGIDMKDAVVAINFVDKATGKVFDSTGPIRLIPQQGTGPSV